MLVTPSCVVPIEFKEGAKKLERLDFEHAWDYGLDLKIFYALSHAAVILSILCAAEAPRSDARGRPPSPDVFHPSFCCSGDERGRAIRLTLEPRPLYLWGDWHR